MKDQNTNMAGDRREIGVKKEIFPSSESLKAQISRRETTNNRNKSGSKGQKRSSNTIDSIIHEKRKKNKSTVVYFPKPLDMAVFEQKIDNSVADRPVSSNLRTNMEQFVEQLPRQVKERTTVSGEDSPQLKLNFKYMKTGRLLALANRVFGFHGWRTGLVKPVEVVHYEVKFAKSVGKPQPVTYTDNYFEKLDGLVKYEDEVDRLAALYANESVENKLQTSEKEELQAEGPQKKQSYYTIKSVATASLSFSDGTVIESQGTSTVFEISSKAAAFSRAKKEAISNAMKNCFAQFPQYIEKK